MKTLDRRSARTRLALRDALAAEVLEVGDLSKVTVTGVTRRADVTRRTFYSHYRDIPDLVSSVEGEVLCEMERLADEISQVTLPELEEAIGDLRPCPGADDVLAYFRANGELFSALLGEGGDPAFVEKIKAMIHRTVQGRALDGYSSLALPVFDYYLTFVISAEVGVLVRWLTTGMRESDHMMAGIMTALLFVRPGDLYGRPLSFDVPGISQTLATRLKENDHGSNL